MTLLALKLLLAPLFIVGASLVSRRFGVRVAGVLGGLPVIAGPIEATALGNVLVQARSSGAVATLAEMRAIVRASSALKEYQPRERQAWTDANGRFRELLSMPG